ncbi:uncharacterized protein FIESC28_03214 [Fusarium coffeatum]|uniref:Uncharacterized protein n=1 Tax=Fusarium coffeatum TaxID=231269 RepID=A0A366S3L7_9HYPO|nr:uncharacterized protein FIESC28_03214 [Fusarium coffeatum]RBR23904.1 hypothetical protein FIESC28_03214 [Fusarium coffeatum]
MTTNPRSSSQPSRKQPPDGSPSLPEHGSRYPIPRKASVQGSYEYIHYRPIWTDPTWQDKGPARDKTAFKICDPIFDRLRPALLPRDNFSNPTIYAQRFGIFPSRTDGRSRASPTRSESRKLFNVSTDIKTGKQLFDRFDELAKDAGQHVNDYMEQARPDMQKMNDTDQKYRQQYEDLLIDEHWQNILFGSLTMDEILAEGYFVRDNTEVNQLSGPLYGLFDRERWADCRKLGKNAESPRYVYTLDGKREEWDPRNNDRVWDVLQPALQLATRLLLMDENFIDGLKDITNRFWIDERLFIDMEDQNRNKKVRFLRDRDALGPRKVEGAQKLKDTGIDTNSLSWEALCRVFSIKLTSGFDSKGKTTKDHSSLGYCLAPQFFDHHTKIIVHIDAELVWPLLVDKYTKSEKLMANTVLASCIAHEMMHAFVSSTYKWLREPVSFGITDPEQIAACRTLDVALRDYENIDRWDEPCFEDDHFGEAGHAYQEHVMAGGYWPFTYSTTKFNMPPLLRTAAGLICLHLRSEWERKEVPNLEESDAHFTDLSHFIRFEDVSKFFSQSFWEVAIEKYGSAALREPSKKPHKFNFYPADQEYNDLAIESLNVSPEREEFLIKVTDKLKEEGRYILYNYLYNIVAETASYDLMKERLLGEIARWVDVQRWAKLGGEIQMILCEFAAHINQVHLADFDTKSLELLYEIWDKTREKLGCTADWDAEMLYQNIAPFDNRRELWAQKLQSGKVEHFEGRVVPRLMDFAKVVERELAHHETLLCELYQGGSTLFDLWVSDVPEAMPVWREHVKDLQVVFKDLGTLLNIIGDGMKRLEGDWGQRILTLGGRVEDLVRLLELDASNHNWRDLMWTLPMLRKSRRLPHQRYYFLAKKEMLKLTVKNLVGRLNEEQKAAQQANNDRIASNLRSNRGATTLQGEAVAQAGRTPLIPPKFQQMQMDNQPVPFSESKSFNGNSGSFSVYSVTGSPFPAHEPNQPSAWVANSAADLAVQANRPLGGATPAAHGTMPHPYAIRETVTEDLPHTAAFSIPSRDPSAFVNQHPREIMAAPVNTPGAGPLGVTYQQREQVIDSDSDIDLADVPAGGHAAKAGAVLDIGPSSSDTDLSEDETGEGSNTTPLWTSDENEQVSTGSDELSRSKKYEKGVKRQTLKRKSSWAPAPVKKQRVEPSKPERKVNHRKRKGESVSWRKVLSGLSGGY